MAAASSALPTALQHVGWGASDPFEWYRDAHENGVEPDTRGHTLFQTDDEPTAAGTGQMFEQLIGTDPQGCFSVQDEIAYMYVLGPDEERIELWSGQDGHVNHLHFTTTDVAGTLDWYRQFLDTDTRMGAFFLDGLLFFFEADGEASSYEPTESHVLGHLAFSVTDLSAWRERVDSLSIDVVAEPAEVHGFESFFVRGPDNVLIELVPAAPLPMLCLAEE